MVRLALVLLTSTSLFAQCDDVEISTKKAKRISEVVFQGTVEGSKGTRPHRTVIFRVSRVWKGKVGPTIEMLAPETKGAMCDAFWEGAPRYWKRTCGLRIAAAPNRRNQRFASHTV
jgi:hypothetical protein